MQISTYYITKIVYYPKFHLNPPKTAAKTNMYMIF